MHYQLVHMVARTTKTPEYGKVFISIKASGSTLTTAQNDIVTQLKKYNVEQGNSVVVGLETTSLVLTTTQYDENVQLKLEIL